MAIPHPGWDPHESKEANVRLSAPVLTAMLSSCPPAARASTRQSTAAVYRAVTVGRNAKVRQPSDLALPRQAVDARS